MQAFYEKYKDEDVVILAVNPNRTENRGVDNSKRRRRKQENLLKKKLIPSPYCWIGMILSGLSISKRYSCQLYYR